ncbi:sushi, von Willebrand factor type A, EGF and pentraxin domain-containing protein 1-like isoform X1 [Lytechinus variegatus]|uniref:sushi, von Willebrand factor type A, EGF and pentraxin domain-containing protein 1-like isoform X1 n=2 Tax=Lytechinus variegatus TaxID=7654 RepID=UPI001BB24980|nr:sushi, von Willebrand factor type A, EGF and pentraxin domain-containing protein 1-like isoform X1 [Lytechinus variegatus]
MMGMCYLINILLLFMCFEVSYERRLPVRAPDLKLLLDSGINVSFPDEHRQLDFADYPQADGLASQPRPADDPLPLPLLQSLSYLNIDLERSHHELYEALWRNADVPIDTTSATKIDVLGYLLKKQVQKLRRVSNGQVELVFLVDSSASVGIENFFNELKFVKKLLADFTVAPDATRVAIITFSSKHRVELNVNQLDNSIPGKHHHKCALLNEDLPMITYVGGGTYTKGAFELAKKVLQGARGNSTQAVFLLTDGLSNGPNPVPVAASLKEDGVEVFTFGIRDGYIPELLEMASEKKDEHCYILDSFAEFEALARRALHEDLRMGEFIEETPEKCSSRCLDESHCCDVMASCRCGTHTGSYDCVCPAGFYGSGLRGKCSPCPIGSYKREALPGGINTCLPCPDQNHVSPLNNTSPNMCVCKDGYRWDIATQRCKVIHCPLLQRPENGEFVECSNVVNGACAIRCNRGYEVTGSSIRLCFSNGSWSGEDFNCRVKTCEVLTAPLNGSLQCTSDDHAFGTVCAATCDTGFKLIGSQSRRCLPIAHWDGLPVHCRAIQCPMLPTIPHGYMTPSHCSTHRQDYGNVCKIECSQGFYRRGPRKKECLANGRWNNKFDPSRACIDYMPPSLECPSDINTVTSPHMDRVVLEWEVPRPIDNSGEMPLLHALPNVYPPWTFPLGHWNITYSATDQSGNIAQCVFSVIVEDREPPSIRRCRSPTTFITSKQEHEVTWEEPLFSDNSGGDVTVTRSHDPGSSFPLGTTLVEYLATDAAGNTRSCVIYVDVQQNLCEKPRDPVGGSAICFHTTQGMNCSVTCGPGYAMSTRPRNQYFCALNGTWYPDGKVPWDDCSETHHANNVLQPMTFLYETSKCDSVFARNMEKLLATNLEEPIRDYCGDNVRCELASVRADCEDRDPIRFLHGASSSLQQSGSGSDSRLALQGGGEVSLTAQRLQILQSPNLFVNIVVNASASPNETAALTGPTEQTYQMVVQVAASVPGQIQSNLANGTIVSSTNRTLDRSFQIDRITVYREDIQPECSVGSVRRGEGEDAKCVQCIPGTYFDMMTSSCEYCEIGQYQNLIGQLTCIHCPNGTSTVSTKSTSLADCKAYCEPGSRSSTGLELCELCPTNTYQPNRGSTQCLQCPRRRYTASHGARTLSDCRAYCPRGKTSANGLTPCLPCPAGTFKMSQRSSYCLLCPEDYPLSNPGSITITYCRNSAKQRSPAGRMMSLRSLPFSECFSSPCRNGGTCESSPGGFICTCRPGYTGLRCEVDINECETAICMNNGSCRDLIDGYMCHCRRGFTGRHCSEDVDECNTNPCFNGATCVDGPQYYECICPDGYTGKNCEEDIDDCALDPCYNHATCTDFIGGYNCTCPLGYHGDLCEMEIDECLSYPCDNNATCHNLVNEFRCECLAGFSGSLCEINIDECASRPCQNGATCNDLIDGIHCVCMPGFTGVFCEEEMSWDYTMVFDRGGIDDYVLLEHDFPTLTAVTISFWMYTDNEGNYGTVFSYAVSDTIDNALTIKDYTGFVLSVNEENIVSDITGNDGRWHHIVATWDSNGGTYTMYKDGVLEANGTGLASGTTVPGGGKLIIGQDQDALGGGFAHIESFIGEITFLTVWDRVLGADEIYELGRTCEKPSDVIIAWPDFLSGIEGQIKQVNNTFCQGCPRPTMPEMGFVKGYLPGRPLTSVTYHCNLGFEMPRHEVRRAECQISGEWSPGDRAYCDRINCGYPGHLKHGYVIGRMYLYGDQVFYTCVENFTLVGPLTRQCMENGYWSAFTPQCRYIYCREPQQVPNAVVFSSEGARPVHMAFPHQNATYQCAQGYRLIGSPNVTCQIDGEWTAPPTCRIVTCPPLASPLNSMLITTNGSVFTSIAEYRCITGYRMTGANVLQCQENGSWDNPIPTCTIMSCGHPPDVSHATSSYEEITYGNSVVYACHDGYEADWTVSHCGANGQWEPSPPECRRIQCSMPPAIANGSMTGGDYRFNSSVTYDCDHGYIINGDREISCMSNGQWSSSPPFCQAVPCGKPPEMDIHQPLVDQVTEFTYGMTVEYTCKIGYLFASDSIDLTCGADGEWIGTLSDCDPISCGPPNEIPNSNFEGEDYSFNHTVTYYCKTGFILSGDPVVRCLASGQWMESSVRCDIIQCEDPPAVLHAVVSHERLYSESVTYTCESGYVPQGSSDLRCSAEGQWQGDLPVCNPITCDVPIAPDHGFIIGTNRSFQSEVVIQCDVGYHLQGRALVQCQSSGQWSNTSATCIPIKCPEPPTIPHGSVYFDNLIYGSTAKYECHDGYILSGQPFQNCSAEGEWPKEPPTCTLIECGNPPLVENGFYLGKNFTFNSTLVYFCADGFIFGEDVVSMETTCQSDGRWSEEVIECEAVTCGMPPIPPHSIIIGSNVSYLDSVQFECDLGYVLSGSDSATCTSNGTWSYLDTRCDPLDCGIPPDIYNAAYDLNTTTTYGSTTKYYCVVGYHSPSPIRTRCDETGVWSGVVTNNSCQPVACLDTPFVYNGSIEGEGKFVYGDIVRADCHQGFKAPEVHKMRCSQYGTWDPLNITCIPITCPPVLPMDNGFIAVKSSSNGESMVFDCNEGFSMVGNNTLLCEGDGQWSGDIPRCLPIICDDLLTPQNGSVQSNGVSYGSQGVYACDNGFELVGERVTECSGQGIWSNPPPVCTLTECPLPINPAHGIAIFINNRYLDEVTFQCEPGYRLVGLARRHCQENGTWSGNQPTCIPVECRVNEAFPLGIVIRNHTVFRGDKVLYSCNPGYKIAGQAFRICGNDGILAGEQPTCIRVTCGPPPDLLNGNVTLPNDKYESNATYSCSLGYTLDGPTSRQCLSNGSWSFSNHNCRVIECPSPQPIEHGTFAMNTQVPIYKSKLTYTCDVGYTVRGDHILTCDEQGSWTNTLPSCELVSCGMPPSLYKGIVSFNVTSFRSQATYRCWTGYTFTGESVRTCLANGSWSVVSQSCEPVSCGPLPLPIHGEVTTTNITLDGIARYSCNHGYVLNGSRTRTCSLLGKWSGSTPDCQPISCAHPEDIEHGIIISHGNWQLFDEIEYHCTEGYKIQGVSRRICQADQNWSGSLPECRPVSCDTPPMVMNGVRSYKATTFNNSAVYDCHSGYTLHGARLVRCTSNGSWLPNPPHCRPVKCGPLTNPQHGKVILESKVYQSQVHYVCHDGYSTNGPRSRTCLADGTWSGREPDCTPNPCSALPLIPHAIYPPDKTNFVVGDFVQLECENGFQPSAEGMVECLPDQSWSTVEFSCDPLECPRPEAPENGHAEYRALSIGSIVTYSCDTGYTLSGQAMASCDENQRWSNLSPRCQPVTCPQLPISEHMVYSSVSNSVGEAVFVSCRDGLMLVGASRILCTTEGSWSHSLPRCEAASCGPPPPVANGRSFGESYSPGDVVSFRCNRGFYRVGSGSITCMSDYTWSDSTPRCVSFGSIAALERPVCVLPCLHGGKCVGPYTCQCPYGFTGSRCEHVLCTTRCIGGARCKARHPSCQT